MGSGCSKGGGEVAEPVTALTLNTAPRTVVPGSCVLSHPEAISACSRQDYMLLPFIFFEDRQNLLTARLLARHVQGKGLL